MEWPNPLSVFLEKSHEENKYLEARIDIKDREDLLGDEGRCTKYTQRIEAYFSGKGYETFVEDLGLILKDTFIKDKEIITHSQKPLPSSEEVKSVECVWEFNCPEEISQDHIKNLREIYKGLEFEFIS